LTWQFLSDLEENCGLRVLKAKQEVEEEQLH
jgi:hypothetical protein